MYNRYLFIFLKKILDNLEVQIIRTVMIILQIFVNASTHILYGGKDAEKKKAKVVIVLYFLFSQSSR